MTLPSLNALRTFHAVALKGSLSAAAGDLGVTPGAVSRQIKNLEDSVGVALVVRDGRGIRLTADGRALEHGLADAFIQIDEAVERLRRPVAGDRLRVTVPPVFALAWLIPRMERFSMRRPETEVVVVDSGVKTGIAGDSDIAIGWGCFEDNPVAIAEPLSVSERVFPVCRPQVCAEGGLEGATLLHREAVGDSWDWPDWRTFMAATGLNGREPDTGPRLSPSLLLQTAYGGRGVMLANTTVAHDGLCSGLLVRPVTESMTVDSSYWLLTAKAARSRPEVLAFCNWITEEFASCFGRRD